MKSLVKFLLLLALIVGGKLAKQTPPASIAETPAPRIEPANRTVLVHQVLTSEPVVPAVEQQPRQGSPVVTEMF